MISSRLLVVILSGLATLSASAQVARTPAVGPTPNTLAKPLPGVTLVRPPLIPTRGYTLYADPVPAIAPGSEILIFVHGMDSRAEEADDITKALFNALATRPPSSPPPAIWPPMAGNAARVPFAQPEPCDHPDIIAANGQHIAVVPFDTVNGSPVPLYFELSIPAGMLDTPVPPGQTFNVPAAHNIGSNEGRLRGDLRAAASTAQPLQSLRMAAANYAANNPVLGNAFADLSVTGRRSFAAFRQAPPQDAFCQSLGAQLLAGCRTALERAYRVANYLRNGERGDTPALKTAKTNERLALGWIAVSGEDDAPHRPANVPSSDFPQFDLSVVVPTPSGPSPTQTVATRYTIAQYRSPTTGRNLVVISVDLPTSGYADNLDYNLVSPLPAIGTPIPGSFAPTFRTPLLQFIEDFVVNFALTLDQRVPIKNNIRAVMGGSLGGNMTFRLGRRTDVPWMPNFVVWSPASIWDSLVAGNALTDPLLLRHLAVNKSWSYADQAMRSPSASDRATFFGSWDKPIIPIVVPVAQSDTWTSDYYKCKESSVAGARLDRQETYDQRFLGWHWRLGTEQLIYSHQSPISATNPAPLYTLNIKPMLLACGEEDHVAGNDICPATENTVPHMTATPGRALFLQQTGHSLDNERRTMWSEQIVGFLGL